MAGLPCSCILTRCLGSESRPARYRCAPMVSDGGLIRTDKTAPFPYWHGSVWSSRTSVDSEGSKMQSLGSRRWHTPFACDRQCHRSSTSKRNHPPSAQGAAGAAASLCGQERSPEPRLRSHTVHGCFQHKSRAEPLRPRPWGPTAKTLYCMALSRKSLLTPTKIPPKKTMTR